MASSGNGNGFTSRFSIVLQIVTVVAIAIGGFWAAVIQPLANRQDKLDAKTDAAISRSEHEEFKLRIDKDIARLDGIILRERAMIVPRSEQEARWVSTDKDLRLLSDRLNELRNATTSAYTLRDEVQRLQTEIAELRRLTTPPK